MNKELIDKLVEALMLIPEVAGVNIMTEEDVNQMEQDELSRRIAEGGILADKGDSDENLN